MKALVTGGAGFIGSYIVDELVGSGHEVRVFDSLDEQVHGRSGRAPSYLNPAAEFIKGNVLDTEALYRALKGVEVVFHQAAAVGTGQSMYRISHYVGQNSLGTAVLLDLLANRKNRVRKLVVASSMSVYGEGKYLCPECGPVHPGIRPRRRLKRGEWEAECPCCSAKCAPVHTDECTPADPTSVYAVTKLGQEANALAVGKAYGLPVTALRYFNAYGPRQALSNPYTGVCALFSSRIRNGAAPLIFEDGLQTRDLVHVSDVARANILAMESEKADHRVFNVGSGQAVSIMELARKLIRIIRPEEDMRPEVTRTFREGDIRHCFADISSIRDSLGYAPSVSLDDGIRELAGWAASQQCEDRSRQAYDELSRRGLVG